MTKLSVILYIIKQRISNILLLSVMFSSLIVIFMVGLGIKDIFYDYLQSDYGNIPDLKIRLNNLNNKTTDKIVQDIQQHYNQDDIDFLVGYETLEPVSIVDSEDLLLTSGLSLLIKGIRFDKHIDLKIDGIMHSLEILAVSYQDDLFIKFKLNNLKVQDVNSIQLYLKGEPIEYGFCKDITIQNDILTIKAKPCKTKVDNLIEVLQKNKAKNIKVEIDGEVFQTKIKFVDDYYKSLIVQNVKNLKEAKHTSVAYQDIEIDNTMIENTDIEDDELIINFKQNDNMVKNYKIFLSKVLRKFINYHRMILKLNLHSFANDDADDKEDKQMVYLNELTDLIDIIFAKHNGNLAVSSTFLAQDLNNFAILDNFTLKGPSYQYNINIRSTIEYNPEIGYDKNILILNQDVLKNNMNIKDKNNYIDIYGDVDSEVIKSIVNKYDKQVKLITQEDIIPSIKPKKFLFDTTIIVVSLFILAILFIAMYIVLLQFYSNFNSELSLLKLYGSKIPYQAFINSVSFVISAAINYIFLNYEQGVINSIMLKYFFRNYEISLYDYFTSLSILLVYVILMFILEYKQIKELNLIKGQ